MKKILLIDDEEEVVDSTSLLLQKIGCEVFTTYTESEIFQVIKNNEIDIIFLDGCIPQLSNRNISTYAKKINKNIKVIWFSGLELSDIEDKDGLYDGLLGKPFKMNDLEKIIK